MLSSEINDAKTNMHLYTVWLKVGFMKCRYALHVSLRMINAKIGYRCRVSGQELVGKMSEYDMFAPTRKLFRESRCFFLSWLEKISVAAFNSVVGGKKSLLVCWFLPQNGSQKGSRLLKIYTHFEHVTNSNRLCRNKKDVSFRCVCKDFFSPNVLAVVFLQ